MQTRSGHRRRFLNPAWVGGVILAAVFAVCVLTLPLTLASGPRGGRYYDQQYLDAHHSAPSLASIGDGAASRWHLLLGTDALGRSVLHRGLLGGSISLGIGLAAAAITVIIGTSWGLIAGYAGGRVDALMMRFVDILYGLPYILLVVLINVALQEPFQQWLGAAVGNVVTLLLAIGVVSWLTLARVVRGQVLSLRSQPFVEAARATGCSTPRILAHHVLPNLIGPIIVYTTLTVPQAILQESFLSFLGIGVQAPLPSWGNLAAAGLTELNPVKSHWWLLALPCVLLGVTLLALNFVGDGLRDRFDPKSR